jgi:MoaA/NifB/PqqE/SkfB family radical SAM enzyme
MQPQLSDVYNRLHAAANYRLRDLASGRWANWCRPTAIAILLTERCNARCLHCDIWKNRGREDQPTVAQWKAVLSDLRRWLGPIHVAFTGGEALLMPFTPELVSHASTLGLLVEHLTHGYWKDQSRIESLARARPWRVTLSLDGLGTTHDVVRGRQQFFDFVLQTLETLVRVRREAGATFAIRLKHVIMEHNLHESADVARFAREKGVEVYYQPIEQNYNTADDPRWFEHSANWPRNPQRAVETVEQLIRLKRRGFPIANTIEQLKVMIPYFRDPESLLVATQSHTALDGAQCSATTNLQIQSNGDVKTCCGMPPIGNIRAATIRDIWYRRPRYWEGGCCRDVRMSEKERAAIAARTSRGSSRRWWSTKKSSSA